MIAGMEIWLGVAFAAGAVIGAACAIVLMAALMMAKEAELRAPRWPEPAPVISRSRAR